MSHSNRFIQLTQSFAERKYLKKKVNLEYREDSNRPRLYCDEPAVVARFASHVRQAAKRKWGKESKVLTRGQTQNYEGMVPSLFRPPSDRTSVQDLLDAESEFVDRIQSELELRRFERDNLGALLQHYGLRSSWIDLVDNLWVSVWFATHCTRNKSGNTSNYQLREDNNGWIYFISPQAGPSKPKCLDLRKAHQGLSLRLHTQHGWALKGANNSIDDLNQYVVATVEFPIYEAWHLSGYLGSEEFLFPPKRLDDTLSKLAESDIESWARDIETSHGIPEKSLGSLLD